MPVRSTLARAAAGALLANAVPHGVAALIRRPFPTPFADPPGRGLSQPGTNLAWSATNAALGAALLRGYDGSTRERAALLASGVLSGAGLAVYFGRLDLDVPPAD
ncbi:hypothetical protein KG112_03380 [Nocardioides sp. zg-ZUI104]|uniref:hypothetical protein n=1 Tax=Nocardioides faecalis TaxID=2803858 RepID=UPI001BCD826A|nr:hypothetical protein [Nocardioides faecalis]MBS4751848.1 hypothetical protein [Nocardioides faecalis]